MPVKIAILDYDVGNLKSISNALSYLGFSCLITGEGREVETADALILPGVGAFPDAADKLKRTGLDEILRKQGEMKPILGICLGMQLLFQDSDEGRVCPGLDLIPGHVRRIPTSLKLPHIGWNSLTFTQNSPLFRHIDEHSAVYFVHSYAAAQVPPEALLAVTDYGVPVTAAVGRGNVYGCQFHPEKSGEVGLQILRNFGDLSR